MATVLNDGRSDAGSAQAHARRNRLLSCLQQDAFDALAGSATRVRLSQGEALSSAGAPLTHVYFPESGLISVTMDPPGDRASHFGLYGSEGFGSIASVLRSPASPFAEIVQQAGFAQRLGVRNLFELFRRMPEIESLFVRYAHVFMMQIADGSASLGCRVEQRLARCLLMLQDREMSGHLTITHQRLADLVGVRRAGVTDAIHLLEGRKLISARRAMITIIDRQQLQALTGGCYGRAEREYQRIILSDEA